LEKSFNDAGLSPEQVFKNSERLGAIMQEIDLKSNRWIELSDAE
jgi:hypothetical protein